MWALEVVVGELAMMWDIAVEQMASIEEWDFV
jgi:hypothetical protein